MLSLQEWHERYVQQARWTSSVRRFLFQRIPPYTIQAVLEVGCGTGAILGEINEYFPTSVYGIDINFPILRFANHLRPDSRLGCADGMQLPFRKGAFSLTFCHFYLLWVSQPLQAVLEMARVTRPGGYVLATAEPDYGGRIDYPEELAILGRLQSEALRKQGVNPQTGRKIKAFFHQAGLRNVQAGVLGGQWGETPEPGFIEAEWKMIENDLGKGENGGYITSLKARDASAWQNGERILFVPTFYAIGQV